MKNEQMTLPQALDILSRFILQCYAVIDEKPELYPVFRDEALAIDRVFEFIDELKKIDE